MEKRKIFLNKNFIAGVFAVVFGVGMLATYGTSQGTYPLIVFLLLVVLGMLSLLTAWKAPSASAIEKIPLRELGVMVLLFANPIMAKTVGFYVSAVLSIFAIMLLFDPPKSARRAGKTALVTVCTAVGVYLIFTVLLRISTPTGFLI